MCSKRRRVFQRNEDLEDLLKEINGLLGPIEEQIFNDYEMPQYPVILVVGCPRAGTTLFMQWLASLGYFAYPTNLLSRFYGAPYIGARIQQLLTDPTYNFNNELCDLGGDISFSSNLGKTRGALSPNEFWYFWRRFIPNEQPEHLDAYLLAKIDVHGLTSELAAIEAVFDKPFVTKGHILEFNIPFLSSILDKVLFIHIQRQPFYNIQSLLEARVKYYGDRSVWYSVRPKEYEEIKELEPIDQVAGQVYFTNVAIKEGISKIDSERSLTVRYEDFCACPSIIFDRIVNKLFQLGYNTDWTYKGPKHFSPTNQVRLSSREVKGILRAYFHFSGMEISI